MPAWQQTKKHSVWNRCHENSSLARHPHAAAYIDGSLLKRAVHQQQYRQDPSHNCVDTESAPSQSIHVHPANPSMCARFFQSRGRKATKQKYICCWLSDGQPNCKLSQEFYQTKDPTVLKPTNDQSTALAPNVHNAHSSKQHLQYQMGRNPHPWVRAASHGIAKGAASLQHYRPQ